MSDTEIPADLIALKLEFYTAERALAQLARAEDVPSQDWKAAHNRLGAAAVAIHRHPALQALTGPDRLKLDAAASKAARAQLDAQDSAAG